MSTYKVLVIDDEKPARDIIKIFLEDQTGMEVVGEAENGFEGLKLIQSQQPDIIFLDIQMPKLTGFELLELIDNPPVIIFSTAYDEYALKAFELHAADYLLKPYDQSRFNEAVEKALLNIRNKEGFKLTEPIVQEYHQEPAHRIVVKDGTKVTIIPIQDIIRISAQDDYCEIVTPQGKFLKKQTMKHFETILDDQKFVRVHRSSIIQVAAMTKIEKYGKETHLASMQNGDEVVVSASGHTRLKVLLGW